ncbi:helix-turn-helix domain-containing protein [Pseudomonas aeruginosa]|uniref:helix-turn-helix domain-containing protein n=1 Tax=Pseudomonas aeruginosa TaxID=287 RepID=UPI000774FAC3|nr:helix-turn-helix transcriptional regulator [Pseudomonas aeruginosa]RTR52964.1 XRE family transcriptional regulator [Pseudomonas aeruginosa]RTR64190.1 XRE family transcriptional regulator [Pseudomonas aeruginosa]
MELRKAFGTGLRALRERRQMAQEDLGGNYSQSYLSQLETGHRAVSLEKADSLARAIGVHPLTLLAKTYAVQEQLSHTALLALVKAELESLEPSKVRQK